MPAAGIGKLLREKGKMEEDDDEEKTRRESFEKGVSIEGEYKVCVGSGKVH